MRRSMSEMTWLARSDTALSSSPGCGVGLVDGVGMARQRRDADVEIGEQRQSREQLVQLVDGRDVEDADVGVAPGDAPQVRPAPVALERLRVLALARPELVGLVRRH